MNHNVMNTAKLEDARGEPPRERSEALVEGLTHRAAVNGSDGLMYLEVVYSVTYDSETKATKEVMTNAEFPNSVIAYYKSPSRQAGPLGPPENMTQMIDDAARPKSDLVTIHELIDPPIPRG